MDKKRKKGMNITGVLAAVLLFLLLGVIGALMLFIPDMRLLYFCYVAGGICLAYGALLLIRYFAKKEYENIANYDFSIGLITLILGVVTLVRAEEVEQIIFLYLGLMILVEGVILLQHTVQMKSMRGIWMFTFLCATVFIIFAMLVLLNIQNFYVTYPTVFYGGLLAVGVLGLLSQGIVAIRSGKYQKEEAEKRHRNQMEEDTYDLMHAKDLDVIEEQKETKKEQEVTSQTDGDVASQE